jgi:hypothetical protein
VSVPHIETHSRAIRRVSACRVSSVCVRESCATRDCQIPLKNLKIGPDLTEFGTLCTLQCVPRLVMTGRGD